MSDRFLKEYLKVKIVTKGSKLNADNIRAYGKIISYEYNGKQYYLWGDFDDKTFRRISYYPTKYMGNKKGKELIKKGLIKEFKIVPIEKGVNYLFVK
jgi:hypothetical protein